MTADPDPGMTPPGNPAPGSPRPEKQKHRLPPWARVMLQLLLTLGITLLLVDRLGVGARDILSLDRALPDPRAVPLVLSIPLLLGVFFLAARFWGLMVAELGGRDPGGGGSFRIVMVANLGRYLPGKLWPLAGLALLSRREGIPASTGTTAGLLVQGFSLAGAAVVAFPILWMGVGQGMGPAGAEGAPGGLPASASGADGGFGMVAVGVLLLLVLLASVPTVTGTGLRILFRIARRDPAEAPRPGASFGPRWLVLNVLLWVGYGLAFALFLHGLGFDVPVRVSVPAFTAAYLLGYVALFAPAGIGIREGVLIAFLQPSLGGAAAAVAVLARVWMTVVELIPAGILAARELLRNGGGRRDEAR
jgi:glycosyltransferase 2 family protein